MKIGQLKTRADFLRLRRTKLRTASTGLVLQAQAMPAMAREAQAKGHPDMRVGYTASKKVGNAVHRNRAKRRLRALTREVLSVQAQPGHDYVMIARTATVSRDFADLKADLHFSLKRLGLLREGAGA